MGLFITTASLLVSSILMSTFSECGDGYCDSSSGENFINCSEDCPAGTCGNGFCDIPLGETFLDCPDDCGSYCGDGYCDIGFNENDSNCADDCADGNGAGTCGDGYCDPAYGENSSSCSEDCGDNSEGSVCGDGICDEDENLNSCPDDCALPEPSCGDGYCDEGSETEVSCPEDCDIPPPADCGNGICEPYLGENEEECPEDCVGNEGGSCPPGTIVNCANENSCGPEYWIGDGYCDGYSASYGINFCCHENDGGDCTDEQCTEGDYDNDGNNDNATIEDCNGNQAPEGWLGDGYCDDGSYYFNGVQIALNCTEYNCDEGDCNCDPGACCLENNDCIENTEDKCDNLDGSWLGPNTPCLLCNFRSAPEPPAWFGVPETNEQDCDEEYECGDGFCDSADGEDESSCPEDCLDGGARNKDISRGAEGDPNEEGDGPGESNGCGDGYCDETNGEDACNCEVDCNPYIHAESSAWGMDASTHGAIFLTFDNQITAPGVHESTGHVQILSPVYNFEDFNPETFEGSIDGFGGEDEPFALKLSVPIESKNPTRTVAKMDDNWAVAIITEENNNGELNGKVLSFKRVEGTPDCTNGSNLNCAEWEQDLSYTLPFYFSNQEMTDVSLHGNILYTTFIDDDTHYLYRIELGTSNASQISLPNDLPITTQITSVSHYNDKVVIGNATMKEVHVMNFFESNLSLVQTITAPDIDRENAFGRNVCISENLLVVAATSLSNHWDHSGYNTNIAESCGDGFCNGYSGEDSDNCEEDCGEGGYGTYCGDGFCSSFNDENGDNCPEDCYYGGGIMYCGDGTCQDFIGEDADSCPDDCDSEARTTTNCGDGICEEGEDDIDSSNYCASDCAAGGGGYCGDGYCDILMLDHVYCQEDCIDSGGGDCGDGYCDVGSGETHISCPTDCDGGTWQGTFEFDPFSYMNQPSYLACYTLSDANIWKIESVILPNENESYELGLYDLEIHDNKILANLTQMILVETDADNDSEEYEVPSRCIDEFILPDLSVPGRDWVRTRRFTAEDPNWDGHGIQFGMTRWALLSFDTFYDGIGFLNYGSMWLNYGGGLISENMNWSGGAPGTISDPLIGEEPRALQFFGFNLDDQSYSVEIDTNIDEIGVLWVGGSDVNFYSKNTSKNINPDFVFIEDIFDGIGELHLSDITLNTSWISMGDFESPQDGGNSVLSLNRSSITTSRLMMSEGSTLQINLDQLNQATPEAAIRVTNRAQLSGMLEIYSEDTDGNPSSIQIGDEFILIEAKYVGAPWDDEQYTTFDGIFLPDQDNGVLIEIAYEPFGEPDPDEEGAYMGLRVVARAVQAGQDTDLDTPDTLAIGGNVLDMATGDFGAGYNPFDRADGKDPNVPDGNDELAILVQGHPATIQIFTRDENSSLKKISEIRVGNDPTGIEAADFDGDGDIDLAVIDRENNGTLTVIPKTNGAGADKFEQGISIATFQTRPSSITSTDVDNDGNAEILVANLGEPSNDPSNPFNGSVDLVGYNPFDRPQLVALGNFAQNKAITAISKTITIDQTMPTTDDFAFGSAATGMAGNFGTGYNPFGRSGESLNQSGVGPGMAEVIRADLDGDNLPETLVVGEANGKITFLRGASDGGFAGELTISVGGSPKDAEVLDIDGDNDLDIALINALPGINGGKEIVVIENRSTPGTLLFVEGLRLNEESTTPTKLVSGDLDGDDIKDLIVIREVITARGVVGGIAVFEPVEQTCPGDANNDGAVDVLDLLAVIGSFGSNGPTGDINADNSVDVLDLLEVIGNFGQSCN